MEEWVQGFQSFTIQLQQLVKVQAVVPFKMNFTWNMYNDGLKMQFPLQNTAQAQNLLDSAMMNANHIIQNQEYQRLGNFSSPGFGPQANPVPQFVQPAMPFNSSPFGEGGNNPFPPHPWTQFTGFNGFNYQAQAEREEAQLTSPTAPAQGRTRANTTGGTRRVSFTLFSITSKPLTNQ
jgi:hypothetical protein